MVNSTSDYAELFNDSLERCILNPQFFYDFYDTLTGASPDIAKLFENVELNGQVTMMRKSLYILVASAGRELERNEYWTTIAKQHKEMGIRSEWYAVWLTSLLLTVKKHDPEFNEEIRAAWYFMLESGIKVFKELNE